MVSHESEELLHQLPVGSFLIRNSGSQGKPENADYEVLTLVVNVLKKYSETENYPETIKIQVYVSLYKEEEETDDQSEIREPPPPYVTPMPASKFASNKLTSIQDSVNLTKYKSLLTKQSCGLFLPDNKNDYPSIAKMLLYHNIVPIKL